MGVGLPICEHLCTPGACLLAGISGCCATDEENRYYGWKVARPCCHFICRFNSSQDNVSRSVVVKEIPMLVIVIAGLPG